MQTMISDLSSSEFQETDNTPGSQSPLVGDRSAQNSEYETTGATLHYRTGGYLY